MNPSWFDHFHDLHKVSTGISLVVFTILFIVLSYTGFRFFKLDQTALTVSLLPRSPGTIACLNAFLCLILMSRVAYDLAQFLGKIPHKQGQIRLWTPINETLGYMPTPTSIMAVFVTWELLPIVALLILVWQFPSLRVRNYKLRNLSDAEDDADARGLGHDRRHSATLSEELLRPHSVSTSHMGVGERSSSFLQMYKAQLQAASVASSKDRDNFLHTSEQMSWNTNRTPTFGSGFTLYCSE